MELPLPLSPHICDTHTPGVFHGHDGSDEESLVPNLGHNDDGYGSYKSMEEMEVFF